MTKWITENTTSYDTSIYKKQNKIPKHIFCSCDIAKLISVINCFSFWMLKFCKWYRLQCYPDKKKAKQNTENIFCSCDINKLITLLFFHFGCGNLVSSIILSVIQTLMMQVIWHKTIYKAVKVIGKVFKYWMNECLPARPYRKISQLRCNIRSFLTDRGIVMLI